MGKSQIKKGILLSYVSTAIEFAVSFIYTPILIRTLGQSEYGTYNYVVSVISYLTVFSSGFSSAYLRQYALGKSNGKNIEGINGKFAIIYGTIALLMLSIGSIVAFNSDSFFGGKVTESELNSISTLVWIVLFNLIITCLGSIFDGYILANEKFVIQKTLIIIKNILRPVIILSLVFNSPTSITLAVGTSMVNLGLIIANAIVSIYYLKMKFEFSYIRIHELFPIFRFTFYVMLSVAVDKINWSVDSFILGKTIGSTSIAIYSVGSTLNTHYQTLGEVVSNVFIPRVHKLVADGASRSIISDLFIKIGRIQYMLLLLICSGFILFGQQFILLWVGKGYEQSYLIALILMLPVTVPEIQKIGIEIQRALNLHKFRSVVYALIAIANILLSLILVRKYEAIGCAIGTAISLIVGNIVIMNVYYSYKIKLAVKHFFFEMAKISLSVSPAFICGVLIKQIWNCSSWISLILCAGLYCSIYCCLIYLIAMNKWEKSLVATTLLRIIRKEND